MDQNPYESPHDNQVTNRIAVWKRAVFIVALIAAIIAGAFLALYLLIEFFGAAFLRHAFQSPGPQ